MPCLSTRLHRAEAHRVHFAEAGGPDEALEGDWGGHFNWSRPTADGDFFDVKEPGTGLGRVGKFHLDFLAGGPGFRFRRGRAVETGPAGGDVGAAGFVGETKPFVKEVFTEQFGAIPAFDRFPGQGVVLSAGFPAFPARHDGGFTDRLPEHGFLEDGLRDDDRRFDQKVRSGQAQIPGGEQSFADRRHQLRPGRKQAKCRLTFDEEPGAGRIAIFVAGQMRSIPAAIDRHVTAPEWRKTEKLDSVLMLIAMVQITGELRLDDFKGLIQCGRKK